MSGGVSVWIFVHQYPYTCVGSVSIVETTELVRGAWHYQYLIPCWTNTNRGNDRRSGYDIYTDTYTDIQRTDIKRTDTGSPPHPHTLHPRQNIT